MHSGEVLSTNNNGLFAEYHTFLTILVIKALKNFIDEAIKGLSNENNHLQELLKANRTGLPPDM